MPAGAPSHDDEPIRIGDAFSNEGVDSRHHVFIGIVVIMSDHVALEIVAVPRTTAIVGAQHGVALRGKHRKITAPSAERQLIRTLWPAMNLADEGNFGSCTIVQRVRK